MAHSTMLIDEREKAVGRDECVRETTQETEINTQKQEIISGRRIIRIEL